MGRRRPTVRNGASTRMAAQVAGRRRVLAFVHRYDAGGSIPRSSMSPSRSRCVAAPGRVPVGVRTRGRSRRCGRGRRRRRSRRRRPARTAPTMTEAVDWADEPRLRDGAANSSRLQRPTRPGWRPGDPGRPAAAGAGLRDDVAPRRSGGVDAHVRRAGPRSRGSRIGPVGGGAGVVRPTRRPACWRATRRQSSFTRLPRAPRSLPSMITVGNGTAPVRQPTDPRPASRRRGWLSACEDVPTGCQDAGRPPTALK